MKRAISLVAALATLVSCSVVEQEIDYMRESLGELQAMVEAFNSDISFLQHYVGEIQEAGYAVNVEFFTEDGEEKLSVTFKDGKTFVVSSARQGKDGVTDMCLMSVKEEDGVWYWTIFGEWVILPDGSRAIAVGKDGHIGVTPIMRIVEGWWEVSLDNGESWQRVIEAKGKDGYTVFVAVDTSNDKYISLTLSDGQVLQVPRFQPLQINMDVPSEKCLIAGGETRAVPYDLTGVVPEDMFLVAGSDGKYKVLIEKETKEKGKLLVTAPQEYSDGYVFLMADDGDGNSFLKVVEFTERTVEWEGGPEYSVKSDGGGLEIFFNANFECSVSIGEGYAEWISNVGSSYSSNKFSLYVSSNPDDKVRVGLVNVCPADNPEFTFTTLTIIQAGRGSMIDRPSLEVDSDGGTFRIKLFSTDGISLSDLDESEALWIERELTDGGGGEWYLDIIVHKNRQYEGRTAEFTLYNAAGTAKRGTITIYQKPWSAERKNDMILTGRANMADDFTIYLPLRGEVDCLVDWGDGTTDRIARRLQNDDWVSHRYDDSGPESYTISISGTVEALNSDGIPLTYGIISIEQWGRLGLQRMDNAFNNFPRLTYLPPDLTGSFKTVTSFQYAFANCIRLTDISAGLFDYSENATDLRGVFSGCSRLKRIPQRLFAGCRNVIFLSSAFSDCTNLASIPSSLLNGCASLQNCSSLFSNCRSIKQVPENLFESCPELTSMSSTFSGTGLQHIPGGLFAANTRITDFSGCFAGCPIQEILGNLFASNKEVKNFSSCFSGCRLKTIPANLLDNNRKVTNFSYMFSGNFSNDGGDAMIVTESPYTIIKGRKVHLYERKDCADYFSVPLDYSGCFSNKDSFLDDIPDEWL